MSERRNSVLNDGSEYYGQSVGLPLEETLQTVRFLSKVKPSGKYRHELTAYAREKDGTVDAWAGHRLDEIHVKRDGQSSTVEVELQDEIPGAIWLDIDEADIMIGGHPKVVMGHSNHYYSYRDDKFRAHHNNRYYHQFSEKNAMRAAELVLRLANKRFANLGQEIVRHNAETAEEKLRRQLAREQKASVHFDTVLESK